MQATGQGSPHESCRGRAGAQLSITQQEIPHTLWRKPARVWLSSPLRDTQLTCSHSSPWGRDWGRITELTPARHHSSRASPTAALPWAAAPGPSNLTALPPWKASCFSSHSLHVVNSHQINNVLIFLEFPVNPYKFSWFSMIFSAKCSSWNMLPFRCQAQEG